MNKKAIMRSSVFFLTPLLGVLCIEIFVRGNISEALSWLSANSKIYFISVIIFFAFQLFVLAIVNNIYLTTLVMYTLFALLVIVNKFKLSMRDEPLLPWDITFMDQVANLLPVLYKSVNPIILILSFGILLLIIYVVIKYSKYQLFNWIPRVLLGIISVILLVFVYNFPNNFMNNVFNSSGAVNLVYDQKLNQSTNGFIAGFILNIPYIKIEKPDNYSEEYLVEKLENLEEQHYETDETKPNIVVVMSEAFWEIKNLNMGNQFEVLHPTVDEYKIGHLISPAFGGGTANVEFEVLTGYSMTNLPIGSVPYEHYIASDTQSLAHTLSEKGYTTTAIHTYTKSFWNRVEAYDHLGFEKFIGQEDLEQPNYNGVFIDDAVINDLIIDEIAGNEQPSFIYAITMQNHGGYLDDRYGESTLQLANTGSADLNQIINTYSTGIKYSDQMLNNLFEEIEKLEEPTLVVFFGDHLPLMEGVYTELGYVQDMYVQTLDELLKMKQTPLVAWSNYQNEISNVDNISAAFLGPKILEWAKLDAPLFYSFLNDFSKQMPGYSAQFKLSNDGELMHETKEELKEIEDLYKLLQYDLLFGEKYVQEWLFETASH